MRPWVIANALMGVNRAITWAIQEQAQQGRSGGSIARSVLTQGGKAFALLDDGLDQLG